MMPSSAHPASHQLSEGQIAAVRAELIALQTSDCFSSSKRCQDLLCFVVEHALAGDYGSLSERFLVVELFRRAIDYETATDSIVRVRASDVRRRLGQYYSEHRAPRAVRIELAAGGYIPEFHWISKDEVDFPSESTNTASLKQDLALTPAELPALEIEANETTSATEHSQRHARTAAWTVGMFALIAVIVSSLTLRTRPSNFDRFWQPVLSAPSPPLLSLPTTDVIQLNLDPKRTLGPLDRLQPGEFLKLGREDMIGYHDWFVSLPVLQATLSVELALEQKGKIPQIRVGTDLRRDELRGHPIIALGSFSNPGVKQDVSGLRFTFDRGASDREPPRIRDGFNPQRSWTLAHTYPESQDKDYAIITRTFDPVTREPFVSLAGLHSFGNQVAGEFISQDASWNEVARRAPTGWEKMNLQIVLEANVIGTTPGSPRILDIYFWK